MIIQKYVKKNAGLLCKGSSLHDFDRTPFYCGWRVYCIDYSCVSYVWLTNQCSLLVDKIKIFDKLSGCGLYTGALNRLKITVLFI